MSPNPTWRRRSWKASDTRSAAAIVIVWEGGNTNHVFSIAEQADHRTAGVGLFYIKSPVFRHGEPVSLGIIHQKLREYLYNPDTVFTERAYTGRRAAPGVIESSFIFSLTIHPFFFIVR
jgi:hypothetical protein